MLVGGVIYLGPAAIGVGGQLCDGFGLSSRTTGTGVGLDALFLTGSLLGDSTAVPGVVDSLYILADRAGLAVFAIACIGPGTVVVTACNGNSCGTNAASDSTVCSSQAGSTGNSVGAKSSGILNLKGNLEDVTLNGCVAVHKVTRHVAGSSRDARSVAGQYSGAADIFKYILVVGEHEAATGTGVYLGGANRYGDGVAAIGGVGRGSHGHGCCLCCQCRDRQHGSDQQQDYEY